MKKERKKPPIRTTTQYKSLNKIFNGRRLTHKEKLDILIPLNEFEIKGNGLPEKISNEGDHPNLNLGLDIRIAHDTEGNVELSYAWKDSDRYTVIPFAGLTEKQSCQAAGDLQRNIKRMIGYVCFDLATACVENQLKTKEQKRKLHNELCESNSYRYKILLGLGRYKTVEVSENDETVTKTAVFIDYGAEPQSAEEIENEKRDFLAEVYAALKEIKKKRIQKPKQKDLMPYMFQMHADKQKKISEMFKKHNFAFKTLLVVFNTTADKNDFMNVAIQLKKITSK